MSDAPEVVFNPVLPEGFEFVAENNIDPPSPGSDLYMIQAKTYVVENYNAHHDIPLRVEDMYIPWFAKVMNNWKAIVTSPQARGMVWMVTRNGNRQEIYIEIYKKLNNIRISTRRDKA